jgi:hypothetical protein
MRKLPTPWSIIWTDNVCCRIITIAPVVFFLALVIKLTGTIPGGRGKPDRPVDPEVASMVLACAVALMLILSAIVVLRVARIRSLFDGGREIEASVRKVKRFRGGSKLKLEFELHGIPYKVSSTFQRSSKTPVFSEGTRIAVLVDPSNPKRAIPLALYGDPGSAPRGERPMSADDQSWIQKVLGPKHRPDAPGNRARR